MKNVKFLRPTMMYQPGDQASFDDERADGLIRGRVAEAVEGPVNTLPPNHNARVMEEDRKSRSLAPQAAK